MAFIPWFGEPFASTLRDFTLLVFEHPTYQLTLLCRGTAVIAIRCSYLVAPPTWAVMDEDARRFLPRWPWQRWRGRAGPPLRMDSGWLLAQRSVPDYALRALAAM